MKTVRAMILAAIFSSTGVLQAQDKGQESNPVSGENQQMVRQIAALRDRLTRVRMVSFEKISIDDQYKTAGIIAELLNRAEQQIFNLLPPGRYPFSWAGFDRPRGMVAQAEELLKTLSLGKDPFAGKYAEPGGYVVDHALIKKDGLHHLFYIRGTAVTSWPEYPAFNFGHAVSHDLVHWKIEAPVLQCPSSGCDQYQVWSPHIVEHKGVYYMFYTGVNTNVCQAICLVTSTDLYNWKRSEKNPVITTKGWGMWDANQWSDCRDPMVLNAGGIFYCYYTARRKSAESGQPEYCIGISSSDDLLHWKYDGFIRLKHSLTTPPESPFVVKHNDNYYLTYTSYKYGTVYVTSAHPVKGWTELPVEKMALLGNVSGHEFSASEIYQDNDKWYLSYISHQKNGLHFFEICELQWNKGGRISISKASE